MSAFEAFSDRSAHYDKVRKAILKAYELVPEAYRQKFRNARKQDGQTYVEFAREKEVLMRTTPLSYEGEDGIVGVFFAVHFIQAS